MASSSVISYNFNYKKHSQPESHFTVQEKKRKVPQNSVIYISGKSSFSHDHQVPVEELKSNKQTENEIKKCKSSADQDQPLNKHAPELQCRLEKIVTSTVFHSPVEKVACLPGYKSRRFRNNEYKKLINRKAAANYRKKKLMQEHSMKSELQTLEEHNICLKEKINWLKNEIYTMKRLSLASKLRTIQPVNHEMLVNTDLVPSQKNSSHCELKIFQDGSIHNNFPKQNLIITNINNKDYTVNNNSANFKFADDLKKSEVKVPVIHFGYSKLNHVPKSPEVIVPDTTYIAEEIEEKETYILPVVSSPSAYEEKNNSFLANMLPEKNTEKNQEGNNSNNFLKPKYKNVEVPVLETEELAINLSQSSLKSPESVVPDDTCMEENPEKPTTVLSSDTPLHTYNDDRCSNDRITSPIPVAEFLVDIKIKNEELSSSSNSCDTVISLTNSNSTSTSDGRSVPSYHQYQWASDESSELSEQHTKCDIKRNMKISERNCADKYCKNFTLPNGPHISEELKVKLKNKVQQMSCETVSVKESCLINSEVVSLCTNKLDKKSKNPDYIKQKNRKAAIRYRQKKMEKQKSLQIELHDLEAHNLRLKEKVKSLHSEIYTLMRIRAASQLRSAKKLVHTEKKASPRSYEERIRMQNREATARYRLKMSAKKKGMENEIIMLELRNKELKSKVNDLNERISHLKKFFKDLIINSKSTISS